MGPVTPTFQCGHTVTLPAMPTRFYRCPDCQAAWEAERTAALAGQSEQDLLDDIFSYDSSDDNRLPPPQTAEDKARIAALHQEARERVARQRAWERQEAYENGGEWW